MSRNYMMDFKPANMVGGKKKVIKIQDLILKKKQGIIEGYVTQVEDIRKVPTIDGIKKKLQLFRIADNSASIDVSLWEDNVLEDLEIYDKVQLRDSYVRIDDFHEKLYLNLNKTGHALRIAWPLSLDIPEKEKKCLIDFKRILKQNIPLVSDVGEETFGIQIQNGNVIKLGLFLGAIPSIPESITNLEKLEYLNLANNHLIELPSTIGKIENLKTLNLRWNRLEKLPSSIDQLKNLQTLDLRYNKFEFIPNSIEILTNLKIFLIDNNPLKSLPDSLPLSILEKYAVNYQEYLPEFEKIGLIALEIAFGEKIPKIDYIGRKSFGYMVEEGHVRGLGLYLKRLNVIPTSIYKFSKLRTLNLSKNLLTYLPNLRGRLPELEEIFVGYNKWKEIPSEYFEIYMKKYEGLSIPRKEKEVLLSLEMQFNESIPNLNQWGQEEKSIGYIIENRNITGLKISNKSLEKIPDYLSNLTHLQFLDFSWNNITNFSNSLKNLTDLEEINLSYNKIEEIPKWISHLSNLGKLRLKSNSIETIPKLQNSNNLRIIDLEQNKIQQIPVSICKLTNLQKLNLKLNTINNIPAEFGQLIKLEDIDLSFNNIEKIPQSFILLESLKFCDVSYNNLKNVPFLDSSLSNLENLDLSHNIIEEIPDSIAEIPNLKSLNLFNNKLSQISNSLLNMPTLQNLDLRLNQLVLSKERLEICARLLANDGYSDKLLMYNPEIEDHYRKFQDLNKEEFNALLSLEFILGEEIPLLRRISRDAFGVRIKDNHVTALNISNKDLNLIPNSIGSLKHATQIYLAGNNLKFIPDEIGRLRNLKILWLNNNKMEYLPSTIGSLSSLTQLNLNNNDLSVLPDSFQNLVSLQILQLENNPFNFLPSVLWPLEKLRSLKLSIYDFDPKLDHVLLSGKKAILNFCQRQHFFYEELLIKIKEDKGLDFSDETNPNLMKFAPLLEEECKDIENQTAKKVLDLLDSRRVVKRKDGLKLLL